MERNEQFGAGKFRLKPKTIFIIICFSVSATSAQEHVPQFDQYPVSSIFKGKPAEPILDTPEKRKFRTMIRQGIAKGWGVHPNGSYGPERPGPNFAGHYIVITWGCGSGCLDMVIADAITGRIYPPPLSVGNIRDQKIAIPNLGLGWADFYHREDSSLFVMKSCPGASGGFKYNFSGTSYFTFGPSGFKLIKRVKCGPEDSN